MRTEAVTKAMKYMSLNKALEYCGMSKQARYYVAHPRDVPIDADAVRTIRRIAAGRPTYGTRRMAAQVARETGMPTNRKKVQRIYRRIGYIQPQKTKNDIIRTVRRLFKPKAPPPVVGDRHHVRLVRNRRVVLLLQRDRLLYPQVDRVRV